ncbi:hypothetical protein BTVI_29475 [Pitangus sulphuratus]|nr:hypothetical protein BTVI_29475 [Pitangus sulphuratus]
MYLLVRELIPLYPSSEDCRQKKVAHAYTYLFMRPKMAPALVVMETELRTRNWQLKLPHLLVAVSMSSPASMETQVRAANARYSRDKPIKNSLTLTSTCSETDKSGSSCENFTFLPVTESKNGSPDHHNLLNRNPSMVTAKSHSTHGCIPSGPTDLRMSNLPKCSLTQLSFTKWQTNNMVFITAADSLCYSAFNENYESFNIYLMMLNSYRVPISHLENLGVSSE